MNAIADGWQCDSNERRPQRRLSRGDQQGRSCDAVQFTRVSDGVHGLTTLIVDAGNVVAASTLFMYWSLKTMPFQSDVMRQSIGPLKMLVHSWSSLIGKTHFGMGKEQTYARTGHVSSECYAFLQIETQN